jgi:hypothetical protein
MEFIDFLGEMLGITKDFAVTKIEKNEFEKTINIPQDLFKEWKGICHL